MSAWGHGEKIGFGRNSGLGGLGGFDAFVDRSTRYEIEDVLK
jgi:hypothetical protein